MSAKETLEDVYQQYISSQKIYDFAKNRTKREPNFGIEIIPYPHKAKKTQLKSHIVDDYFDKLCTDITELYVLKIITTFEKIVFDKIADAYRIIESVITKEYRKRHSKQEPTTLHKSVTSLIKTKEDIFSLSGAKDILEKQISRDSLENLTEIIEYRNWLSHGKRQDVGKDSTLTIEEIKDILIKIVDEIG